MICPYCNKAAELVKGNEIYPHRKDLHLLNFWFCRQCDAYVGCHKGSNKPLGRLANTELRKYKRQAHSLFDPLWKSGNMKRGLAYSWLSKELGIEINDCHIGMFDVDMCKKVIEICKKK